VSEYQIAEALFYAFGQIDSGNYPNLRLVDAYEFQDEQLQVFDYAQGLYSVDALSTAWKEFVKRKDEQAKAAPKEWSRGFTYGGLSE
jgi:hypothetical protein